MQDHEQSGAMPFLDHVRELRRRVISSVIALAIGFVIAFATYSQYVALLLEPFGNIEIMMTQIAQGFMVRVKIAVYAGIVLSFPVHVYNCVSFILPALTETEKRFVRWALIGSLGLLVFGLYMAYFQILPLSFTFLTSDAFVPGGVQPRLDLETNLTFLFRLLLAFVALFQLPLVLLLLLAMNVVTRRQLLRSGRYIIIAIFVVSAILTPPDPISQLGLGLPLIVLFYATILVAWVFKLGPEPE